MKAPISRRDFLRNSALAAGAATMGAPLLGAATAMPAAAQDAGSGAAAGLSPVLINANEYPQGPSAAAQKAIAEIAPQGGRYLVELQMELRQELADQLGVQPDNIMMYAGSTEPLDYTMLAFTSPTASLVTADPTFESGWRAAARNQAQVHKVPLRQDFSHDVQAMCAADAKAGVLYICNPNNPTGSITARKDIDYALAHKPQGSVLVVDEAYIHFSDTAVSAVDLVAKGEDVVILCTFSKLYGMAGIRLGYAVARPDLLKKLMYFSMNSLPVTAVAAGLASLRDPQLVPQRRNANTAVRNGTVAFLKARDFTCTASESNCFMVDVKRPAKAFMADMATWGVYVGRSWAIWPNASRITVGTPAEMERFKQAFDLVLEGKLGPVAPRPQMAGLTEHRDGSVHVA